METSTLYNFSGKLNLKLAIVALLLASPLWFQGEANAIPINQCWSSCNNVSGDESATVATVTITDSGTDKVAFTLTNSIGNLSAADADSYISLFEFNYIGSEALSFSSITGDATGSFLTGSSTDAGLNFNLKLDFPPPATGGPSSNPEYFLDTESVSWTIEGTGLLASDFSNPMMVHIQSLGGVSDFSVKYASVPAPGIALLIGLGMIGIVVGGRLKRRSVSV